MATSFRQQIDSNSGGGFAILHQHLFWFYSHPAVYIMILPAMGIVSDIISVFAQADLRLSPDGLRPGRHRVSWLHRLGPSHVPERHESDAGHDLRRQHDVHRRPSAIKVFNWLGTLWGGNIRFTVPMLNALAFVSMFIIGGLSGIFMASTPVDVHIHATYFIVAHIHYVLFGGSMFGIFGAINTGIRKCSADDEQHARLYPFLPDLITFNCTFFPMHILGLGGMPRRVAGYMNYPTFAHFQPMNEFITHQRICSWASRRFSCDQFHRKLDLGQKSAGQSLGGQHPGMDRHDQPPAARKFHASAGGAPRPVRIQFAVG